MLRKISDARVRPGTTPPFRGADGRILPGSIAEVGHLRLGGLPQWVMIRGRDRAQPVLVLLHGGPGFSETHFFRCFNAALEESFTVVYWDQRGSGRSFDPAIPRTSMTVDRFVADLDELVDTVCRRVGTDKVTIFGHSWGSGLGTLYAARFPDKVAAFVGSGQIGDCQAGDSSSYAFALAEAQRLGRRRTERTLRAVGPPPWTAEKLWTERVCLNRLEGRLNPRTLWELAGMFRRVPELSLLDLAPLMRGFRFSLEAMWDEVSHLDLTTAVPALAMPVFFFLGRHDHWVPPESSVAYFDALAAPAKRLVWFEKSGHEPFVDEAATFNTAMVEVVRPVS